MKTRTVLASLIVFTLLLAACSAAALPTEAPVSAVQRKSLQDSSSGAAPAAPMEAPAAAEGFAQAPAIAATPAPAQPPPGAGGVAGLIVSDSGRMVIKDAIMELQVQNTDRAVDDVTNLAVTQGGYIISSRTWFDNDQKYANIKMGIPSANFERTLTFLRALGLKVVNETASGQDVSSEYNDLQSRLTNLEATEARVRTFLDEAKTVEESLQINATLTDLEGQINQIKGQMKFYEGRSAYSTIDVTLDPLSPTPTVTPTPTSTPTPTPWNPGSTIKTAANTGTHVWQSIIDGLIWICFVGWPILLVALIIVGIVWFVRQRKAKQAASQQSQIVAPPSSSTKSEPPQTPPAS